MQIVMYGGGENSLLTTSILLCEIESKDITWENMDRKVPWVWEEKRSY